MEEIKISVLLDNNLIQANGLSRFTFIPSGRPYLMYTLNEKSIQNGESLNKVYVSEEGDKTTQFQPINQDEWVNLKNIMGQLGETNAQIPNNIQLSQLNATQYVVGPYKKIAINDTVMANIVANQIANQPKEEQIAQPTGNTQFFDSSLNVSAMEETNTVETTEVPNAFGMTAPVPEEAAPISLVEQAPQAEVQAPVAEAPAATTLVQEVQPAPTELIQPVVNTIESAQPVEMPQPIEMPVQAVEMPAQAVEMPQVTATSVEPVQSVQPIVETTVQTVQPMDDMAIVKQALQTVLNYCNGDMNKLTQLLNEQGLTVVVQNMNDTQVQAPVAEAQEEFPEPVTSVSDMSIENLPVVEQEAPAEENVLAEESFEPTAPTLPIDNMEAQNVVNSLPDGVIPGGLPVAETQVVEQTPVANTEVVQPVAETPVADNIVQFPAQDVATQPVETPVATNVVSMDNIVPFVADTNVVPVEPVAQAEPVAPVATTEVVQPVAAAPVADNIVQFPVQDVTTQPVETPAASYEVPTTVQPVEFVQPQPVTDVTQTEIIQPGQAAPAAPVAVEAVQNTEVSIAVPADISPAGSPVAEAPAVNAAAQDLGIPTIIPLTQEDMAPATPAAEVVDTSFLDAGPVVMPDGQANVQSMGLPGDSGAKVLERVA